MCIFLYFHTYFVLWSKDTDHWQLHILIMLYMSKQKAMRKFIGRDFSFKKNCIEKTIKQSQANKLLKIFFLSNLIVIYRKAPVNINVWSPDLNELTNLAGRRCSVSLIHKRGA